MNCHFERLTISIVYDSLITISSWRGAYDSFMNKNIALVVGSIIIIILAGLFIYVAYGNNGVFGSNATSTVTTDTPDSTGTTNVTDTTTGTVSQPGTVAGSAPNATTNSTVAPTDTTAVVTGTVNPNGAITTYWYEFGTTPVLGKSTSVQTVGSGYTAIPTPGYVTGLTKNTTYYYRLVAQNTYGKNTGEQRSVTTTNGTPAPVGSVPAAKTLAISTQSSSSATLLGTVNPNKSSTQYWFEYGTNGNLGNITKFVSVGNGGSTINASAAIANLSGGTTYYYRLNAQNEFGTVNGAILTFKTTGPTASIAPVVTTQVAAPVATTTATFNATVNPGGASTRYWFEYSTDSLLGSVLLKTTSQKTIAGNQGTVSVQADVNNLKANTTYYVRIVAQNAQGTVRGAKESFSTK